MGLTGTDDPYHRSTDTGRPSATRTATREDAPMRRTAPATGTAAVTTTALAVPGAAVTTDTNPWD